MTEVSGACLARPVRLRDLKKEFVQWLTQESSVYLELLNLEEHAARKSRIIELSKESREELLELVLFSAENMKDNTWRSDPVVRRRNFDVFGQAVSLFARSPSYVEDLSVVQSLRLYRTVEELAADPQRLGYGMDLNNLREVRARIILAADLPPETELDPGDLEELRAALEQAKLRKLDSGMPALVEIDSLDTFADPRSARDELDVVMDDLNASRAWGERQGASSGFIQARRAFLDERDKAVTELSPLLGPDGPVTAELIEEFRALRKASSGGHINLGDTRIDDDYGHPIWRRINSASLSPSARAVLGDLDGGDYMLKLSRPLMGFQYDFPREEILGMIDEEVIHGFNGAYSIAKYIPNLQNLRTPLATSDRALRIRNLSIFWIAAAFLRNLHRKHGLAHRDLKPENIFFVEDAAGKITRILIGDKCSLCPSSWTRDEPRLRDPQGRFFGSEYYHRCAFRPNGICNGFNAAQLDQFAMMVSFLSLAMGQEVTARCTNIDDLSVLVYRIPAGLLSPDLEFLLKAYLAGREPPEGLYETIYTSIAKERESEIRELIAGIDNDAEREYLEAELGRALGSGG